MFTPPVVNISRPFSSGLGQGAYLGGAAGKLGGERLHFPSLLSLPVVVT